MGFPAELLLIINKRSTLYFSVENLSGSRVSLSQSLKPAGANSPSSHTNVEHHLQAKKTKHTVKSLN